MPLQMQNLLGIHIGDFPLFNVSPKCGHVVIIFSTVEGTVLEKTTFLLCTSKDMEKTAVLKA